LASSVIAGLSVNIMFVVQLALYQTKIDINYSQMVKEDPKVIKSVMKLVNSVQLGLDIVWDLYGIIAVFLFALNMYNHPKLGKIFSVPGIVAALLLLFFNIYFFPTPPTNAGSIDFGPLIALWFLAVTIQIARSLKWVNAKCTSE